MGNKKNLLKVERGGGGLTSENCKKVQKDFKIPRVTINPLKKTHKTSSRDCSILVVHVLYMILTN